VYLIASTLLDGGHLPPAFVTPFLRVPLCFFVHKNIYSSGGLKEVKFYGGIFVFFLVTVDRSLKKRFTAQQISDIHLVMCLLKENVEFLF
jgi:hypothetical protein